MPEQVNPANKVNRSTGFYEAKGLARYTLIVGRNHKKQIDEFADEFQISQANVIEVLLEQADKEILRPYFAAKKQTGGRRRKNGSVTHRELMTHFKDITQHELEIARQAILAAKEMT